MSNVTIPQNVTSIGDYTFAYCQSLTNFTVPNGVTSIGKDVFQWCAGLRSITIPNSVTSIGDWAFYNCTSLEKVIISDLSAWCCISFGEGPSNPLFYANHLYLGESTEITDLVIPDGITKIGNHAFERCSGITSVTIPNSVITIGENSFYGCDGLKLLTIGSDVVDIYKQAFAYCKELTEVYCYAKKIPYTVQIFNNSFVEYATLYVPASLIEQYKVKAPWSGFGKIEILNYIDGIYYNLNGDEAEVTYRDDNYNSYSGTVIIPESITYRGKKFSVTKIGDNAFRSCSDLTSVIIPNSVNSIGSYAFAYSKNLASIIIPDGVPNIAEYTFSNCSCLTSVTIPNSVTEINAGALSDCSSLSDVYCNAEIVPNTHSTTFDNSPIKSATLHTPNKSIHLYKQSSPWSSFGRYAGLYGSEYTLSYIIDDNEYKSCKFWEDEKIFPEDEPTKEGHTFSGWSEIPETMPAHDVTVTGSFSINSYKLTYIVDGEEYKSYELNYGSSITAEVEPSKVGHTFSGWSEIPETMPAHDVTVTGSFSVNSYTLTYIVDGEVYKTYEIEYGTTIIPEESPTKTGYTFSGWGEIPSTMPAKDVTLSGTFSINKYKLTYVVDGEEYKTVEVEYNSTITPEAEPTKEGHTFSGWSEIPETMPAYDVTVTGSFAVNTYTLTYMVDGEVYMTSEVVYGTTITPESAPTKTGYSFSGWDDVPLTMPARDVTVNGSFTINSYKLTYIVDGEEYKTFEIVYDSAITPEAEPTKEGHTFSGWSDIPERMPANDVTVTGSFIVNKYQITYVIDGEVFATDYVEYGATIVPPKVEEREGYSFSGWSDIPETMPAHDIVVHASYTSGIIGVLIASQQNVRIYSPNGKKLDKLQKGLNIVILGDGTVKKVMVK